MDMASGTEKRKNVGVGMSRSGVGLRLRGVGAVGRIFGDGREDYEIHINDE
jgi:hypothetical protein